MRKSEARRGLRIGIDARSLKQGPAGVATYVRNLLAHLPSLDPLEGATPSNNFLWNNLRAAASQWTRRWALYHASGYTAPLWNRCPLVLTVHDISYLACPEWYPYRLDRWRRLYYEASLRRADRIIVVSDFTKSELLGLFPTLEPRVRRIPLAASTSFRPDPGQAHCTRTRLGLPESFALHVGDIHRRRNLPLLARAAARCNLPLVAVGRVLDPGLNLGGIALRLQDLPEAELRGLYGAASVFAYASLYEGFGLPVLEAMACGLPVVAARRASIPEVCGEAAILVEPEVEALAGGIEQALRHPDRFRKQGLLQSRRFSWAHTAALTSKVYQELL